MKRTVKAWAMVWPDGIVAASQGCPQNRAQIWAKNDGRSVPCTITYDDGYPNPRNPDQRITKEWEAAMERRLKRLVGSKPKRKRKPHA